MDVIWIMIPFLILVLVGFFLVVFFLPEWVGITGKHAKSITAHQEGREIEPPRSLTSETLNESSSNDPTKL